MSGPAEQANSIIETAKAFALDAKAKVEQTLQELASTDLTYDPLGAEFIAEGDPTGDIGDPSMGSFTSSMSPKEITETDFIPTQVVDKAEGDFTPSTTIGSVSAGAFNPTNTVTGPSGIGVYNAGISVPGVTSGAFNPSQKVTALQFTGFTPTHKIDAVNYSPPQFSTVDKLTYSKLIPKTTIDKVDVGDPDFEVDATIEVVDPPEFMPTGPLTVTFDPRPDVDLLANSVIQSWAPDLVDITVDPAPEVDIGSPPPVIQIATPIVLPELNLPEYEEVDFGPEPPIPVLSFGFTNERYSSALVDALRNKILDAFNNGTGLPDAIRVRLFARASEQVEKDALQARQQARKDRAALGYSSPPGALFLDLRRIEQRRIDDKSKLNRDQYIDDHQKELEEIRYYAAQGIALEGILVEEHARYLQRELESARYVLDAAIAIFGVQRDLYNLRAQRAEINARVMEAQIRAELAKLEKSRIEVEIQQLQAQVQRTEIEAYRALADAVRLKIDRYLAYIEGVKVRQANEESKIRVFEGRVRAYAEGVRAQSEAVGAWADGVRGEVSKLGVIETQARAFGAEMDGWRTGVQAKIEEKRLNFEAANLEVERVKLVLQAALAKLDSQTRQLEQEYRAHNTEYDVRARVIASQTDLVRSEALEHQTEYQARSAVASYRADAVRTEVARNLATYQARAAVASAAGEVARAEASAFSASRSAEASAAGAAASAVSAEASVNSARASALASAAQAQAAAVRAEATAHEATVGGQAAAVSANASAYSAEARGFEAKMSAKAATARSQADIVQADAAAHGARLRAQEAAAGAQASVIRAQTDEYRAMLAKYEVDGQLEIAKAAEVNRAAALTIERTRANAQLKLEAARIALDNTRRSQEMKVEIARATGQAAAALASAAFGAVQANASISGSSSDSTQHIYNY